MEVNKMKTKIKETLSTILVLTLMLCALSACGTNSEKNIIGKWYNNDGKCLDIRSDGSYKLEDSYGTGTWKYLDDNETIEFTDVYGDTNETIVETDDTGDYIKFSPHGNFYRKTENINENEMPSIELTKAGNFSDGVAWITYNDETGTEQLALINTDGKILYKEVNSYTFLPPEMHGGVSYIKNSDSNYKLIKKEGNIVADSQNNEFDNILACGDGFALVYKYSGPKDSKHLYGVLDNTGELVCNFIDLGFAASTKPETSFNFYKGCGIFSISYTGGTALLNLNTEKVIHLSGSAPEFINSTAYIPEGYYITNAIQDGNHFGMEALPACIIDTDFNITNRDDITSSYKYPYTYSSNGIIIAYEAGNGNNPISIIDPKTNNKYTLDYTKQQLKYLEYIDDFGLLKIGASDGNTYFTLLDKQGNEQFEPMKYQTVIYSDEKAIYKIEGKYTIIDTEGKVLAENLEYKTINEFNEDIAVAITIYDEYCFINAKGEKILQNIHE